MSAPPLNEVMSNHIGEELRRRREEKKFSVEDVSTRLKISTAYLTAIENLNTSDLPSIGYVLGYVRSYAALLGMSPSEAASRYRTDSEAPDNIIKSERRNFVYKQGIRLPKGSFAAASIAATFAIAAIWYSGSSDAQNDTVVPVIATSSVPSTPAVQLDPNILTIAATRATWIEVRNQNGDIVISRIFVPGERFEIARQSGMIMSVRDAGAVSIIRSGESTGPIGPKGQPISAYALP